MAATIIGLSGTVAVVLGAIIALLLSNERRLTKLETTNSFYQTWMENLERDIRELRG